MRSRAVSLPEACCFLMRSAPPPCWIRGPLLAEFFELNVDAGGSRLSLYCCHLYPFVPCRSVLLVCADSWSRPDGSEAGCSRQRKQSNEPAWENRELAFSLIENRGAGFGQLRRSPCCVTWSRPDRAGITAGWWRRRTSRRLAMGALPAGRSRLPADLSLRVRQIHQPIRAAAAITAITDPQVVVRHAAEEAHNPRAKADHQKGQDARSAGSVRRRWRPGNG